ncbi:MAG: acetolactate synthase large subunit [Oribacterium sp.]|nr:acetolactate synthase large subunit [Oribacterium sp.]
MNVAEMLVKALEHENVKYVFGIPGEENLDFMHALKQSDQIRGIVVRHEQGAAFMADVYGRLTGKAGVCFSTLGPGATNLITGVADANGDGAPLVAITAQVTTDKMPLTSHQYLDLETLFQPITKRTKMIVSPESVNEIVRLAFKYAEGQKPGATHVCIPQDVAQMEVPEGSARKLLNRPAEVKEYADETQLEEAAAVINRAEHPVILAGHSAVNGGAAKALTEFAEKLRIPVINTMMAKGIISCKSPYYMCTIGIPQRDYPNLILDQADLVICVGYDIVELAPSKWNRKDQHRILHIDSLPADVNKLYQPEVEVIGDISFSLEQLLLDCDPKKEPEDFFEIRRAITAENLMYQDDNGYPVKPQKLLYDIRKIMGPDDILISDVGAHKMWISRHYDCYKPNTCLISNGFATMGMSVPGAIAAKLVYPERRVLAVCGDGGFMMNMQELETAVREKIPIVVLVLNDGGYGLIRWKEDDRFHDHFFVDFTNPDFVKLAEAMHVRGFRIDKTEDIIPIMEQAFNCGGPALVECPIDYRENEKLTAHLKKLMEQSPTARI